MENILLEYGHIYSMYSYKDHLLFEIFPVKFVTILPFDVVFISCRL